VVFLAFSWNGVHVTQLGIIASADNLPFLPEPKIYTEEIPGRDGFVDFSTFNPAGRVHYRPRDWRFLCSLEALKSRDELDAIQIKLAEFFKNTGIKGRLEVDACPGLWWDSIITNRFDISMVALSMRQFTIYFQSQPFARSIDESDEQLYVWKDVVHES
jgi:hypothetical protein